MQSPHTTMNTQPDSLSSAMGSKAMPIRDARTRNLIIAALISFGAAAPAFGQFNGPVFETQKINSFDAAQGDQFGSSIVIDNQVVFVGARFDRDNFDSSGSVYRQKIRPGIFTTNDERYASTPGLGDRFGTSIDAYDGVVVVGSPLDNTTYGPDAGSVSITNWNSTTTLIPNPVTPGAPNDQFGFSVAIYKDLVVVGAPYRDINGIDSGSVYVFHASTGVQLAEFFPSDPATGDLFGYSVAIANGKIAVGSLNHDHGSSGNDSGAAYLFDTTTFTQVKELLPSSGASEDYFGHSIAIDDTGTVAVGAIGDDTMGANAGSGYAFHASDPGVVINEYMKFQANDAAAGDLLGISIAIDNDIVVVGANGNDDFGDDSGSAYMFIVGGVPAFQGIQLTKLLPSNSRIRDEFGYSVDIDDGFVAVGERNGSGGGCALGFAYVYDFNGCGADLTGDGALEFFDIATFITAFMNNNLVADFNHNGMVDEADAPIFFVAFMAGCH